MMIDMSDSYVNLKYKIILKKKKIQILCTGLG